MKITVKVTPTISKILQELAFTHGYVWASGHQEVLFADAGTLTFNKDRKEITYATSGLQTYTSLEDAIEFLQPSPASNFRVGDWVVNTDLYAFMDEDTTEKNQFIMRITEVKSNDKYLGTGRRWEGIWEENAPFTDYGDKRLATPREVAEMMISEAKKRGFTEETTHIRFIEDGHIKKTDTYHSWYPENNTMGFGGRIIFRNNKWIAEPYSPTLEILENTVTQEEDSPQFKVGCKTFYKDELKSLIDLMRINDIQGIIIDDSNVYLDDLTKLEEFLK